MGLREPGGSALMGATAFPLPHTPRPPIAPRRIPQPAHPREGELGGWGVKGPAGRGFRSARVRRASRSWRRRAWSSQWAAKQPSASVRGRRLGRAAGGGGGRGAGCGVGTTCRVRPMQLWMGAQTTVCGHAKTAGTERWGGGRIWERSTNKHKLGDLGMCILNCCELDAHHRCGGGEGRCAPRAPQGGRWGWPP